jgi:DNA polymerase elongation subunit (family B)
MTKDELEKKIAALKKSIREQEDKVSTYNAMQLAIKVVNNGGYGAIGNVGFRYFRPAISEAITVTGRYIIRHTADRLNWFLNKTLKTEGVDYVIGPILTPLC